MTSQRIDANAQILWDYLQLHQTPERSDAVFVLGSMDTRVAEHAATLFKQGLADYLICSGGLGKLTKGAGKKPEAQIFADIARAAGVPDENILIEDQSTNTGENVQFTYEMLRKKGLSLQSFVLVQKPYMERRTYATFMRQWPRTSTKISVTSPPIAYADYFNQTCPRELVLNVMVGDMQRIREYPKRGLQIEQPIPEDVWQAFERLVAAGYTSHLLK